MGKSKPRRMGWLDRPDLTWRRASRCANAGCVEVAISGSDVFVRDSKRNDGPVLVFDAEEWQAFVAGVKGNEFDV